MPARSNTAQHTAQHSTARTSSTSSGLPSASATSSCARIHPVRKLGEYSFPAEGWSGAYVCVSDQVRCALFVQQIDRNARRLQVQASHSGRTHHIQAARIPPTPLPQRLQLSGLRVAAGAIVEGTSLARVSRAAMNLTLPCLNPGTGQHSQHGAAHSASLTPALHAVPYAIPAPTTCVWRGSQCRRSCGRQTRPAPSAAPSRCW